MAWRISNIVGSAAMAALLPLLVAGPVQGAATPGPAQAAPASGPIVDLALVLAVDVSASIDWAEAQLQRKGLADAFVSPEVVRAIRSGSNGRIGVAVVFFSSYDRGVMDVPISWTVLSDEASAQAFAKAILAAPPMSGRGTSISDALNLSLQVFASMPLRTSKRVIDVSGDGMNSAGPPITGVRERVLAQGISINALPISEDYMGDYLEQYFKGCVVGGPGSFMLPAKGFTDFARAIRRKLVLEISGLTPAEMPQQEARVIRTAAPPLPGQLVPGQPGTGRGLLPRGNEQAETPFRGNCDFPMFGGFGRF